MKRATLVVAGASAVVLVAGAAGARAADVTRPTPVVQPAASGQAQIAATPLDTAVGSTFTPVAACRVADTRTHGGPLAAGTSRDLFVGGTTGFAPQGGTSGGCGIPATATAVAVTVTGLSGNHAGYLKAFRTGAPEPAAVFLNYGARSTVSVASTVGISSNGRVRVKDVGAPTNVIIDVTGYFMAPLTAQVNAAGSLVTGSRTSGAFLIPMTTSGYQVNFDRDVSACTYAASSFYAGYTLTVEPRSGVPNAVYVLAESGGVPAPGWFYLTVTC